MRKQLFIVSCSEITHLLHRIIICTKMFVDMCPVNLFEQSDNI